MGGELPLRVNELERDETVIFWLLRDLLTYEGTSEMHLLAIGKALTGQAAFR